MMRYDVCPTSNDKTLSVVKGHQSSSRKGIPTAENYYYNGKTLIM